MLKKPGHITLSTIHPRLSLKNEMVEREAVRANLLGFGRTSLMSSRRKDDAFCGFFFTNMGIDTVSRQAIRNMETTKRSVAQTMSDYRKLNEFHWLERYGLL